MWIYKQKINIMLTKTEKNGKLYKMYENIKESELWKEKIYY